MGLIWLTFALLIGPWIQQWEDISCVVKCNKSNRFYPEPWAEQGRKLKCLAVINHCMMRPVKTLFKADIAVNSQLVHHHLWLFKISAYAVINIFYTYTSFLFTKYNSSKYYMCYSACQMTVLLVSISKLNAFLCSNYPTNPLSCKIKYQLNYICI